MAEDSARPKNLAILLAERTAVCGGSEAFVWLPEGEAPAAALTFEDLAQRATALATEIVARGGRGERLLVALPPGLDYVVALFAAFFAGAVAVPAYPPEKGREERTLDRLLRIADDAQARIVLGAEGAESLLAAIVARRPAEFLDTSHIGSVTPKRALPGFDTPATAPAVLMYTSGSTGDPRGIILTHENLLYNLEHFPGFASRPCRTVVSWLPFFHDLGLLLAVLHPVYRGARSVVMPPLAFIQRPLRWLEAASRFAATTLGGPNFAFELCRRRAADGAPLMGLDLSSLNLVLNGAEPVRADTLTRFTAAFEPYGFRAAAFYPSYGLADAAATVTGAADFAPPRTITISRQALGRRRVVAVPADAPLEDRLELVGCGPSLAGQRIRIVDPQRRLLVPPGTLGEVWVSGPSVGAGIWGRSTETRRRFGARVPGLSEHHLRTGDLGFVGADGELFLVGRAADTIIVRGVNLYPEDLEPTVAASHPALRPGGGAVVGVETDAGERVAVVQEADPRALGNVGEVFEAIRRRLGQVHDVDPVRIVLLPPGTLPKTSSGKVRRRFTAERLSSRRLQSLAEWREGTEMPACPAPLSPPAGSTGVRHWLLDHFARRLGISAEAIDSARPIAEFGLPSVEAVAMAGELAAWLGRPIPPTIVWDHPTIDALAARLDGEEAPKAHSFHGAPPGRDEPIAILGMSCRFPGAANPEALWSLLVERRDAIREVPRERWNVEEYFDPDPATPGRTITRWGGFLDDVECFDAAFFDISPREANHLDPRQRLMLELASEALEDAGLAPRSLAGSSTGVFLATLSNDYDHLLFEDLRRVDAYSGTGTANSLVANRLSYHFDFRGPSLTLDTACSGSLVALHLACQALRAGDAELALAGGVSLNLVPSGNIFFSRAGALSPTGRCRTFDERADGIVRSDGAGLLVLKPLSAALAAGDRVLGVVRGSAVNQDGHSNGVMAPNRAAQEAVLREAYRRAAVPPAAVDYIEAHGTGTSLGDPIEVAALAALFAERSLENPCRLGSLKTNLGHMEAAAGVGGLIKVLLALRHAALPPNLHFQRGNPLIAFDRIPLRVVTGLESWPAGPRPRIAGVSSFGFGGTNAHVVIEEAPAGTAVLPEPTHPLLLLVSARSDSALSARLDQLAAAIVGVSKAELGAIATTLALRRDSFEYRAAVFAEGPQEAATVCGSLASGAVTAAGVRALGRARREVRLVFAFGGQGSHWPGMGSELLATEPVFRDAIDRLDALAAGRLPRSLAELLSDHDLGSRLDHPAFAQPAVFAVQVALVELLASWRVTPAAVIGQSLGEAAAAWAAGRLALSDAFDVVIARSQLMAEVAGLGATALVGLSVDETELVLSTLGPNIEVAGSSGPQATVVSGVPELVDRVVAALDSQGRFARRIRGVDTAFHGRQMEPLKPRLAAALGHLTSLPGRLPFASAVTGAWNDESLDAAYWARNLREPFRFAEAARAVLDSGYDTVVEIGPDTVLAGTLRRAAEFWGLRADCIGLIERERSPQSSLRVAMGRLFVKGVRPDWRALFAPGPAAELPSYPWQRERYWFDQIETLGVPRPTRSAGYLRDNGLLGELRRSPGNPESASFQSTIHLDAATFLSEHRVEGVAFAPASLLLELLRSAGERLLAGSVVLSEVAFLRPLILGSTPRNFQVVAQSNDISLWSEPSEAGADHGGRTGWIEHCSGRITLADNPQPTASAPPLPRGLALPGDAHYHAMAQRGLQYGQSFRGLVRVWRSAGEAIAELEAPATIAHELSSFGWHPGYLDAIFQVMANAQDQPEGEGADELLYLPIAVEAIELEPLLTPRLRVRCRLRTGEEHDVQCADFEVFDEDGAFRGRIRGLRVARLGAVRRTGGPRTDWLFATTWQPRPRRELTPPARRGPWIVVGPACNLVHAVASRLADEGLAVRCLTPEDLLADDASFPIAASFEEGELAGILCLFPGSEAAPCDLRSVEVEQETILRVVLTVVQGLAERQQRQVVRALSEAGWTSPARVWFVTRGVERPIAAGGPLDLGPASLWGLSRVFAQEYPEAWGGLVDLDPAADDGDSAQQLIVEILHPDGEDHIAFQDAERRVQRLGRLAAEGGRIPQLHPDGTYLITGGLGGLGGVVAHWLVDRGARRLVLASRSEPVARHLWDEAGQAPTIAARIAVVRGLEARGVEVHWLALDVADEKSLVDFTNRWRAEARPRIRGVVHAAGVVEDRLLLATEVTAALEVLRPKVSGGWNLDRHFGTNLDFFVVFGSIASTLGTLGEASYAAAGAYLDALVRRRRAQGLPALVVSWGPWSEVGIAARSELGAQHYEQGMGSIAPVEGCELLDVVWNGREERPLAMAVEWLAWCRAVTQVPPLVAEFATGASLAQEGDAASFLAQLLALEPKARVATVLARLREVVARVLRLDVLRVPTDEPIGALGVDSIMIAEMRQRFDEAIGIKVAIAELMTAPSLEALASQITEKHAQELRTPDGLTET